MKHLQEASLETLVCVGSSCIHARARPLTSQREGLTSQVSSMSSITICLQMAGALAIQRG